MHHKCLRTVVLGSGIIGLTTAHSLLSAGCEVRLVADLPIEATTSYLAAGIWFPTHVGPADRVLGWGERTLQLFAAEAGRLPGVLLRESLMLYRDGPPPVQPDWVASVGLVRPAEPAELPAGYRYGLRFAVPLVDMSLYLPWLLAEVQALGAELVSRHVDTLDELASEPEPIDAIINCTGLAARDLVKDASLYPVRGQIIRVTNPGLTRSVRDEGHPAGRAYVHPRTSDCILGGTMDLNSWDRTVDPATADAILARCLQIVPELAAATVIEHLVGLRPGRPGVRLEEDEPHPNGTRILHNYGHGGAGITLSRGCAEEVTDLVLAPVHG